MTLTITRCSTLYKNHKIVWCTHFEQKYTLDKANYKSDLLLKLDKLKIGQTILFITKQFSQRKTYFGNF